jgi:hypothetical protein
MSDLETEKVEELLIDKIYDCLLEEEERLKLIENFYVENKSKSDGTDMFLEIINNLTSAYNMNPSFLMKQFLIKITDLNVGLVYKFQIGMCIYLEDVETSYKIFFKLLSSSETRDDTFGSSYLVDCYRYLFETNYEMEKVKIMFTSDILLNDKLEVEYRYKILSTIINGNSADDALPSRNPFLGRGISDVSRNLQVDNGPVGVSRICLQNYISYFHHAFLACEKIPTRYRILSAGYLMSNDIHIDECEQILISFSTDTDLDYNLRADSSDTLLRLGSHVGKSIGRQTITMLGKSGGLRTIYNDKQNVHVKEIDESVTSFLNNLADVNVNTKYEPSVIAEYLCLLSPENSEKINSSMIRITIDQALYNGYSLVGIFTKMWFMIQNSESKSLLENRLVEELVDMSDTCGSGHVNRLVNVMSGFGFTMNIGFKNQIKNNLFARLTKMIQEITINGEYKEVIVKDGGGNITSRDRVKMDECELEDYQSTILDQLTMVESDIENKKELANFFRRHLLVIRDELYKEFVPKYVTENEFDEAIRSAIIDFEGQN